MQLTDLPDEILIEILYNLNSNELYTIGLVCKHLRKITNDNFLWHRLCKIHFTCQASKITKSPRKHFFMIKQAADEFNASERQKASFSSQLHLKGIKKKSSEITQLFLSSTLAITFALENKNYSRAIHLMEHGASLSDYDDVGASILQNFVCSGDVQVVEWLLQNGCDVNEQDFIQWTPLHYAATIQNPALIDLLLLYKADPFTGDFGGLTPRDVALEFGREDNAEMLKLIEENLKNQSVINL